MTTYYDPPPYLSLPGFGKASTCVVSPVSSHWPVPVRFVWHHVMPKEAGGLTHVDNLVQVCDSCHYTIHRMLWDLRNGRPIAGNRRQKRLAWQGYLACVEAGTTASIFNEG